MKRVLLYILLFTATIGNAQLNNAGMMNHRVVAEEGIKEGVLAWWEMDEVSGTLMENSHSASFDGTIFGATVNQTGHINKAYDYVEGTTERVEYPTGLSHNLGAMSVSVWFNADDITGTKGLVTQWYGTGYNNHLIRLSNANFQFYTWSATNGQVGGSYYPVTAGSWFHMVCVYDGTTMRVYVNGVLDATSYAQNGDLGWGTDHIGYIGNYTTSSVTTLSFGGLLDQVIIWNRAISGSEVLEVNNSGNGITY